MNQQPTLGFIGAGKVGHTLARLWYRKGYRVRAVYSRTRANALELASLVGAAVVNSPGSVVRAADLTFLTVPDDAIPDVASIIRQELDVVSVVGIKGIVHTSGARDRLILELLAQKGCMTGGLHPAYPFADVETAVARLPGTTFGIEAEDEMLSNWLTALVQALEGYALAIPAGGKAIYHSAFVFASNYMVTLYAIAEQLLTGLGAERETANRALNALVAGTVVNLEQRGVPDALTGPLVRGDVETLEAHLQAMRGIDGELADLYIHLTRLSLPMLTARNMDTTYIEALLNRENHAPDNS
jgi:predicted short-subunit dehydrogenase-like oxidoreductase (DUF2520 family)